MKILVTGATGFVGTALVPALLTDGHFVRTASRQAAGGSEHIGIGDLAAAQDYRPLVTGLDAVIHLAGIAHTSGIDESRNDAVNRGATEALAQAAREAGVSRFVFMSSIRAQTGPASTHELSESDSPAPTDAYGRSKLAAEEAIRASGVPFSILRPVLIYGAGARANLALLSRIAGLPVPLPFAGFENRRSLLARDNLIDAIRFVLGSAQAVGGTYIVADREPIMLRDVIIALARGRGREAKLFPMPSAPARLLLSALGRQDVWERIGGELVARPRKLMAAGWTPRVETKDGLAAL